MVSLEACFESSNSSNTTDLCTYFSLRGHSMSGNYMEEETHDTWPKAKDADVQMRLCCSDLQSLQILDTTDCDTPLSVQSTMLFPPNVGNKGTTFKSSGVLLTRMQSQLSYDGNNAKDSPKGFMEHVRSYSDDLMPSNFNAHEPTSSTSPSDNCHDFDKVGIWVPSLDLDKEDSQWDKDGSDGLSPDFPSPSYRMLQNLRVRTSKLNLCPSFRRLLDAQPALGSPSSLLELSLKRAVGVDSPRRTPHADDPLFWPFEWKSYWQPKFDGNYLGISPRLGIFRIKRARERQALKPLDFGLQQRNWKRRSPPSSLYKENIQQGHRRSRSLINSSSRSEKPTHATKKARPPNNEAPHTCRVPSRLSRSSTRSSSEKSIDINASKKKGKDHPQSGSSKKKRNRDQDSTMIQYLLEFEAGDHIQVYLGGEIPIEALVGLDEFNGQEGLGKMMRTS